MDSANVRFVCCILMIVQSWLMTACQSSSDAKSLQIAVAANAQFTMQHIIPIFEADANIPCELMVGSSGKLTAQITEGAPFDVFISADLKYPESLSERDLTLAPPQIYARGKLVLWTLDPDILPSLETLADPDIKHIGLANPKIAPYGKAAQEVLEMIQLANDRRLVFGESISQTNQFIMSQAVEIGFTAKSVVLAPHIKDKGHWMEIDEEMYAPIQQGVVAIVNKRDMQSESMQFIHFLLSQPIQNILMEFGYQSLHFDEQE